MFPIVDLNPVMQAALEHSTGVQVYHARSVCDALFK